MKKSIQNKLISFIVLLMLIPAMVIPGSAAGNVSFTVTPSANNVMKDKTITFTIGAKGLSDVATYEVKLQYDSKALEFKEAKSLFQGMMPVIQSGSNPILIADSKGTSVNGDKDLCTITFTVKSTGNANVTLLSVKLWNLIGAVTNYSPNQNATVTSIIATSTPSATPTLTPTPTVSPTPTLTSVATNTPKTTSKPLATSSLTPTQAPKASVKPTSVVTKVENVANQLGVMSDKLGDMSPKEQSKVVTEATQLIKNASDSVGKISDEKKLISAVTDIIIQTTKLLKEIDKTVTQKDLTKELTKLVERAIEQTSITTAKAQLVGSSVKAVISTDVIKNLTANTKNAADLEKELVKNLTENGIKSSLETTVTLSLGIVKNAKGVAAELPASVISQLVKNSIDKLEVVSGNNSITIPRSVLPSTAKSVSFEVKNVSILTAAQKSIAKSNLVLDVNAIVTGNNGTKAVLSKLSSKLDIELPYNIKQGEKPNSILIYVKLSNGSLQKYNGNYNSVTKTVSFAADKI